MSQTIIRKLKCETPGCGFICDYLDNGKAFDDVADKKPVELWQNSDGTFECLACGAPIAPWKEGNCLECTHLESHGEDYDCHIAGFRAIKAVCEVNFCKSFLHKENIKEQE